MSESGEGFLSRWSRRKRAAAIPAAPPPAEAPAGADPIEDPIGEEVAAFDASTLPPIESLTAETDITPFLRPQVPAALRRAALRRVWTLDPAIRDYVGPADYAWDYNAADGMAGFSLELGGDVKRLLAQAIGLPEEPEAEAAPEPAMAEMAMAEPAVADAAMAGGTMTNAAMTDAAMAEVTVAEAAGPDRLAEVAPDGPAPPPKRHGSARPA
jgi:Protein of unknown function (DUF3306)